MAIKIIKKLLVAEDMELGLGTVSQDRDINGTGPEEVTYNKVNAGVIPSTDGFIQTDLDDRYTKAQSDAQFALLAGDSAQVFEVAAPSVDTHAVSRGTMNTAISTANADYALKTNVLQKDNLVAFTPTAGTHPCTKGYADALVIAAGAGDMTKAVYDTGNTGTVDDSSLLDGVALSAISSNKGVVTDCNSATTIGAWEGEDISNAPATGRGILEVWEGATKGIICQMFYNTENETVHSRFYDTGAWTSWTDQGETVAVEDVLTSTNSTNALSANQGRVLAENITTVSNSNVPISGIIMYDGLFIDIPANWSLCDGTNGTPDLSSKFIRGTATEANIGDEGGSDDATMPYHTHTGPSHTHTANHNHSASTGSDSHTHTTNAGSARSVNRYIAGADTVSVAVAASTSTSSDSHSHSVTVNTAYITTSSAGTGITGGTGGTGDNRPAYYTLAFIKRIS